MTKQLNELKALNMSRAKMDQLASDLNEVLIQTPYDESLYEPEKIRPVLVSVMESYGLSPDQLEIYKTETDLVYGIPAMKYTFSVGYPVELEDESIRLARLNNYLMDNLDEMKRRRDELIQRGCPGIDEVIRDTEELLRKKHETS